MMLRSEPLYYLMELARCNSYRIASENLHITQPALSIAIKKLEAELGVELVERTTKKIKLTEIGEKVVVMSEHLLEHLSEIEQVKEKIPTKMHYDHMTLYTFPAISESILGQMMMNLQLDEALGKLIIKNMRFGEMMSLLLEDECAFALAWQLDSDQQIFENINCHKLYCAKAQLMLSAESELVAHHVSSIAFKDILQLPLVSYEGGYGIDHLLFELMHERYGTPGKVIEVPNIILFNQIIQSGTAVAFGVDVTGWKSVSENQGFKKNRFVPINENIVFDFKLYCHQNCPEMLKAHVIKLLEDNL